MNRVLLAMAIALVASPLFAEPTIAVPPMRYGRIDTKEFPQPQTISDQPVTGKGGVISGETGPLYLHVPSQQTKRWDKYCQRYQACGRPVYFVRGEWYRDVYTPRYKAAHPKADAEGMDHSDRSRDERGTDADRGHDNLEHGVGDRGPKDSKGRS
jgi:hypothetical protein